MFVEYHSIYNGSLLNPFIDFNSFKIIKKAIRILFFYSNDKIEKIIIKRRVVKFDEIRTYPCKTLNKEE